jgi:hypothetical protein
VTLLLEHSGTVALEKSLLVLRAECEQAALAGGPPWGLWRTERLAEAASDCAECLEDCMRRRLELLIRRLPKKEREKAWHALAQWRRELGERGKGDGKS